MIPAAIREKLGLAPGDTVIYRVTEEGVVISKAVFDAGNDQDIDPFSAFDEWSSPEDEEAFKNLG